MFALCVHVYVGVHVCICGWCVSMCEHVCGCGCACMCAFVMLACTGVLYLFLE